MSGLAAQFFRRGHHVAVNRPLAKKRALAKRKEFVVVWRYQSALHFLGSAAGAALTFHIGGRDVNNHRAVAFVGWIGRPIKLHEHNDRKLQIANVVTGVRLLGENVALVSFPIKRDAAAAGDISSIDEGGNRQAERHDDGCNRDLCFQFQVRNRGERCFYIDVKSILSVAGYR